MNRILLYHVKVDFVAPTFTLMAAQKSMLYHCLCLKKQPLNIAECWTKSDVVNTPCQAPIKWEPVVFGNSFAICTNDWPTVLYLSIYYFSCAICGMSLHSLTQPSPIKCKKIG